ncbi:unnamed protein product [Euphydryas editha]|uniref:DDE Tnp4 domain-containing protein n=1 Tax=Euphydryas editha TaxID=104508 RepID=A0AAU9TRL7_EUPED|nr:unnamed protein product [Euphydryas editha]
MDVIRRPSQHQEDFLSRKKCLSVLLQAVVTPKKLFTDVYIGEPGSMHDARVLRKSPLYERALDDPKFFENYFVLGDSAYPSLSWLVPPFKDNASCILHKICILEKEDVNSDDSSNEENGQ